MKTWLITGCSSGIGREIARVVLEKGDNVIITSRKASLEKLNELSAQYPGKALPVELEVTDIDNVKNTVKKGIEYFGSIDVLVNNAGRGYSGTIEEGDLEGIQELFNTNFFGPVYLIKEVLLEMRKRKSGAIINISSLGALTCNGGSGYYAASKSALEKVSIALRDEVESLGIKVMVVEPGPFRTNFRVSHIPSKDKSIDDYARTKEARQRLFQNPFGQKGDPYKAAKVIVSAIEKENYPKMILLGKGTTNLGVKILSDQIDEIKKWKDISDQTDFDE